MLKGVFDMEADAAKLIGAGLAAIGMIGAGIGVGNVWSSYITAIARNPASKEEIGANIWIGFAVTEAIALFALIVALIALFA
jgi:F0F1-type ATP synthase membrane subunit c/vacuolar-type H+-ATPase subunit K